MTYSYITLPSGLILATDRISGVDFQRAKLAWGIEGSAVDVSASNPLPAILYDAFGVPVDYSGASAAPTTRVTAVTSAATLLAANASRKWALIENDSTAYLDVLFSSGTPSPTNRTRRIWPGDALPVDDWIGIIKGVWTAVNGGANVTEAS